MLYLPALSFEKQEIRLPATADEVISFCSVCSESKFNTEQLQAIFASSPGLFLYVVTAYGKNAKANDGQSTSQAGSLSDLKDFVFESKVESDAFDGFVIDEIQRRRLFKWRDKPTRSRLVKFLAEVSDLDIGQAKRFVKRSVGRDFEYPESVDPSKLRQRLEDHSFYQLPIRQLWLVCAKLQKLEHDFNDQLLEQKMVAMKQLAYGASHEINNPLANIATRAQALMTEESNSSRRQRLSVIYAQAIRAHEMISDMMLFANPPDVTFERNDTVAIIETIVRELQDELVTADVAVRVRQYPDVPVCEFDATQISVAIKAMIQNAIIAIGSCGDIRIQVWRKNENKIAISIADNGPGINETTASQIFDPFFSGREAGRGLGFGLSKAWRIVELHGGRIKLEPNSDDGARFVMTLPIKQTTEIRTTREKSFSRIDNARAA